jgi:hypothetical protein
MFIIKKIVPIEKIPFKTSNVDTWPHNVRMHNQNASADINRNHARFEDGYDDLLMAINRGK